MSGSLSSFDPGKDVGSPVQSCPWIEIELVDEDNQPVPGEKYRVEQSNGKIIEGSLDSQGFVHLTVVRGTCRITFPNLDMDAWEWA
jgi:hypothetical protein